MSEASPPKVKARQLWQDVERATQNRLKADQFLAKSYELLCDAIHARETAFPGDEAKEKIVRQLTQQVIETGEHYQDLANEELELAQAACTLAFQNFIAIKESNRELDAQDAALKETLHGYDHLNLPTELYRSKSQKLQDLRRQIEVSNNKIEHFQAITATKQVAMNQYAPEMETYKNLKLQLERSQDDLRHVQAQFAAVQADQVEMTRKQSQALQKAEHELQHTRQLCDVARKDLYRQQYAAQEVTIAMKALSASASKLKLQLQPALAIPPLEDKSQALLPVNALAKKAKAVPGKKPTNRPKR
ncbi:hypothetical protein AeNC1_012728 [Aphanomyces euteiches]|nr:hypothetical protein AeNC1_012728 [Aphanomyces euteiches]